MTPRSAGLDRLTAPLLRVLNAESADRVLSEAAQLLATLTGARAAAAFMIEGDCAIHEGWYPESAAGGSRETGDLRTLASSCARRAERSAPPWSCSRTRFA